VIRKVDGQPIVASGDLPAIIGLARPGEKVTLEVWRAGKAEQISATLGDAAEKTTQVAKADEPVGKGKLGLSLRPLQPQEKQQSGIASGLVIENAAGPAAASGRLPPRGDRREGKGIDRAAAAWKTGAGNGPPHRRRRA